MLARVPQSFLPSGSRVHRVSPCSSQAQSGPFCWQKGRGHLPPTLNPMCAGVTGDSGPEVFCGFLDGYNWGQLCEALSLGTHWQEPQEPVAKLLCQPPPAAKSGSPCPKTQRQDRLSSVGVGDSTLCAVGRGSQPTLHFPRKVSSPPRFEFF